MVSEYKYNPIYPYTEKEREQSYGERDREKYPRPAIEKQPRPAIVLSLARFGPSESHISTTRIVGIGTGNFFFPFFRSGYEILLLIVFFFCWIGLDLIHFCFGFQGKKKQLLMWIWLPIFRRRSTEPSDSVFLCN